MTDKGVERRIVLCALFCLISISIVTAATPTSLTLKIDQKTGAYTLSLNNKVWFSSSQYKLHVNNKWYTSQDKSLVLSTSSVTSGYDVLGAYNVTSITWLADNVRFVTAAKVYHERLIVFSQEFPDGATGTVLGSEDQPLSTFPSLTVNASLGFLHYSGDMAGSGFQSGMFPKNYQSGFKGGPLAVFDQELNTVVMSTLSYFLSAITNIDVAGGNVLNTGLQGKLMSVPKNFKFEYVFYAGEGVHRTFLGWGDVLLAKYHKTRVLPSASTVLAYLGYSTTGFYFYSPLDYNQSYGNYEDTLLQFNKYSQGLGIPYRYYLLDSWWYGEYTVYNGVWKWEDSPDLLKLRFPNGLEYLHHQLGVPFAAHMGRWVSSTPYAQNPEYGFVVEKTWAIPTRVELFDFIFQNASVWGLNTLKQDHINEQILNMNATLADVNTARNWLLAEGKGASHHGINIEYCMDWASILLTSLENPTATHSRAGGDYVPKEAEDQWNIGVTSIFLWSMGLYPDKDTFYTTTTEVNKNPKSTFYNFQEKYPLLHAIASSMSAGPITPSDGIGGSDRGIIMSMCASDGLLLKPDRPAINIDSTWLQRSFASAGPNGDVITSYTALGPYVWHFVFSANLKTAYTFTVKDLLLPTMAGLKSQAVQYDTSKLSYNSISSFSDTQPLNISVGNLVKPNLWVIAPVFQNGWVYVGEINKFITVSKQRTASVEVTANSVIVEIAGQAKEVVTLGFIAPQQPAVKTFTCTIGASGRSIFVVPDATCTSA